MQAQYGLFTKSDLRDLGGYIRKGSIIAEYVGEVLSYDHVFANTAGFSLDRLSRKDHEYQIELEESVRWAKKSKLGTGSVLNVDGRVFGNEVRTGKGVIAKALILTCLVPD